MLDSAPLLAVAGATGAGKTTVISLAASNLRDLGFTILEEPVSPDTIIAAGSSVEWRDLQRSIVQAKLTSLSRLSGPTVMDRSASEDRHIFFELHRQIGHLSSEDYADLVAWYEDETVSVKKPTGLVFLDTEKRVLMQRAEISGQPRWIVDSLDIQLALYKEWLSRQDAPILIVDSSRSKIEVLDEVLAFVREVSN